MVIDGFSRRAALMLAVAVVLAWSGATSAQADDPSGRVPKQVHLVQDGKRLIASNVKLNRFDELKLDAQERVLQQKAGAAVAVVVTNQRIAAYGVLSGWRFMDRMPGEDIQQIMAEDYAGVIVTSNRLLNFNGQSGVWAEQKRNVAR